MKFFHYYKEDNSVIARSENDVPVSIWLKNQHNHNTRSYWQIVPIGTINITFTSPKYSAYYKEIYVEPNAIDIIFFDVKLQEEFDIKNLTKRNSFFVENSCWYENNSLTKFSIPRADIYISRDNEDIYASRFSALDIFCNIKIIRKSDGAIL